MRLAPSQMGMSLMIRGSLPMMRYDNFAEGIARGRQILIRITRKDFGYDLRAWHKYLVETNAGGYKWSNGHRGYSKAIEAALSDLQWQKAVAIAESGNVLEQINTRDARQREAIACAEQDWGGKSRRCPKCNHEFVSVQDRGQCPKCSHGFYASHPDNKMWWLEIT